jgi:class 3 adenylate cyclase
MGPMSALRSSDRNRLPDRAFAYIDSTGQRRLPIHDAAHVRNALARFGRVDFEDDEARDQARLRLLRAARRLGVAPIGFVTVQLEPQRRLPRGNVTFLLCDIEGSTELLARLGDGYARLRSDIRRTLRNEVRRAGGHEVDTRADEYFAVFAQASAALRGAVEAQRSIGRHPWPADGQPRLRMGIHSGRPSLTSAGYVGLAVHAVARVCAVGHGGQIVLTRATLKSIGGALPEGIDVLTLGEYRLRGLDEPLELLQAIAADLAREFPPPRLL